jgi:hypothetical protein
MEKPEQEEEKTLDGRIHSTDVAAKRSLVRKSEPVPGRGFAGLFRTSSGAAVLLGGT